jgi:hypothetical protein
LQSDAERCGIDIIHAIVVSINAKFLVNVGDRDDPWVGGGKCGKGGLGAGAAISSGSNPSCELPTRKAATVTPCVDFPGLHLFDD